MILILSILVLASACGTKKKDISFTGLDPNRYYHVEIFKGDNLKLYGRWRYLYAKDGVNGTTLNPTYDYLEFIHIGIYSRLIDNQILDIGLSVLEEIVAFGTANRFRPIDPR